MNRSKHFVISGDPAPLARGRIGANADGSYHVFDSQKNLKLIKSIDLQQQMDNAPLFVGPLKINAIFYMKMPKNKSKQKAMDGQLSKQKPDVDNLLKFLLDISNKILYRDDAEVSICTGKKVFDVDPRTEFTITEIQTNEYE